MKKIPLIASLMTILLATLHVHASSINYEVLVYKSPSCGCCNAWIKLLEKDNFTVTAKNTDDMPKIKAKHHVPKQLGSCHTAIIEGYVVEGHIPIQTIKKLIKEKPDIQGIAVPGMPAGSPGMPGKQIRPYAVYAFTKEGKVTLFETINPSSP